MNTMTEAQTDVLNDLDDAVNAGESAVSELRTAQTVEKGEDLIACLEEAEGFAKALLKEIREQLKEARS